MSIKSKGVIKSDLHKKNLSISHKGKVREKSSMVQPSGSSVFHSYKPARKTRASYFM